MITAVSYRKLAPICRNRRHVCAWFTQSSVFIPKYGVNSAGKGCARSTIYSYLGNYISTTLFIDNEQLVSYVSFDGSVMKQVNLCLRTLAG